MKGENSERVLGPRQDRRHLGAVCVGTRRDEIISGIVGTERCASAQSMIISMKRQALDLIAARLLHRAGRSKSVPTLSACTGHLKGLETLLLSVVRVRGKTVWHTIDNLIQLPQ